jgi:hypothetical protein
MATTYTLIASNTVGSGGAANVIFSSFPNTFTDLLIKASTRSDTSGANLNVLFNGNTSNYSDRRLSGNGSSASSDSHSSYPWTTLLEAADSPSFTANTFTNCEIYVPNYNSSNYKSYNIDAVSENNGTTADDRLTAGLWGNSSAITQVQLFGSGNFVQYSTFYLYGISNS